MIFLKRFSTNLKRFPFFKQHDQMDCGPTCLRIILKYYGRNYSIQKLRELSNINKTGVSLLGISEAAEMIGLQPKGVKLQPEKLHQVQLPCVLHWRNKHFVVLYRIRKEKYYISDPSRGLVVYNQDEFLKNWLGRQQIDDGIALFLSPTPFFYQQKDDQQKGLNLSALWNYRKVYSKLIVQLFIGMFVGSLLQLIVPFLTQAIVDTGINTSNIHFITLILVAQLMLFAGSTTVSFLRSWIMLHMTTRLNVTILSDFLAKLMRLPMGFFDSRRSGDIMQRMNDHKRIESFLTGTTLNTLFSLTSLVVYCFVVAYYNKQILFIFGASTVLYTIWILIFMKKRRELDQKRFDNASNNQSNMVELIGDS